MTKRHYLPCLRDTKSVSPMTKELSEMFLQATLLELQDKRDGRLRGFTEEDSNQMGFPGRLLWSRLKIYGRGETQVGMSAAIIALAQCRNPADVVMWAFTLNRLYIEQQKIVTISDLAEAFPIGFPNEKGKEEVWDAQKISNWGVKLDSNDHNDNMLDHVDMLTDTADPNQKQEWCKWLKT